MRKLKVIRSDRASRPVFEVGQIVYPGRDMYGVANTDSNFTGIYHCAISPHESGEPFYTIPLEDVAIYTNTTL